MHVLYTATMVNLSKLPSHLGLVAGDDSCQGAERHGTEFSSATTICSSPVGVMAHCRWPRRPTW